MNFEASIKNYFTKNGMDISDEALELILEQIREYITDITIQTIALGQHKTLMPQDVELALSLVGD